MRKVLLAATAVFVVGAIISPEAARADRLFATHFSIWGTSWITELDPQTGGQINRFAPPAALNQDSGLAYDGINLYFLSGLAQYEDTIYKLDPNNGAVVYELTLPANRYRSGMAALGGSLFFSHWNPSYDIEVYDSATGAHQRTIGFSEFTGGGLPLMIDRGLGAIRNPDGLLATVHAVGDVTPTEILEFSLTGEVLHRFEISGADALNSAQGLTSVGNEIYVGLHLTRAGNQVIVYDRSGTEQRRFGLTGSTGVQALAGGPDLSQVPEPATAVALAGLGVVLLARAGWRRRRQGRTPE